MKKRAVFCRNMLVLVLVFLVQVGFSEKLPKYIFLFIGDGMALPDVLATESYLKDDQAMRGIPADQIKGLVMTHLPVKGMAQTFAKNADITDSAASATALSTGCKTQNGALNIDKESGLKFEPMAQYAKKRGLKVGVISSAAPNHATPAGFYAIAKSRNEYPQIALQLATASLDYVGGPKMLGGPEADHAATEAAVKNGYTIVENRQAFDALKGGAEHVWVRSLMPFLIDSKHEITLADHVQKAIALLKDSDGFFMMVEGAQIDWASHANDAPTMIQELLAFDQAIKIAVDFCNQAPEETLIVVTADHECGGLSLDEARISAPGMSKTIQAQKGSRGASTGLFKEIEQKKLTFDDALPLMQAYFGVKTLTAEESNEIRKIYNKGGESKGDFTYSDSKNITLAWSRLVSQRAGLKWSSLSHTGAPVPVFAMGAQSHRFAGNSDNALIARYIRDMMAERFDRAQ